MRTVQARPALHRTGLGGADRRIGRHRGARRGQEIRRGGSRARRLLAPRRRDQVRALGARRVHRGSRGARLPLLLRPPGPRRAAAAHRSGAGRAAAARGGLDALPRARALRAPGAGAYPRGRPGLSGPPQHPGARLAGEGRAAGGAHVPGAGAASHQLPRRRRRAPPRWPFPPPACAPAWSAVPAAAASRSPPDSAALQPAHTPYPANALCAYVCHFHGCDHLPRGFNTLSHPLVARAGQ